MADMIMVYPAEIVVLQLIGRQGGDRYDLVLKFDSGVDVPTLGIGCTPIR